MSSGDRGVDLARLLGPVFELHGLDPDAEEDILAALGEFLAVPEAPATEDLDLVRLIAVGGMGEVWSVRDPHLGREVALKCLQARFAGDTQMVRRFEEEARVAAELDHPGVVPIYRWGHLPDGRPYYTMKEVEGQSLADRFVGPAVEDLEERVDAVLAAAEVVAHAHGKELLHRDLKPDNILCGSRREIYVVDWGLVMRVGGPDDARRQTKGTRGFEPPEQSGDLDVPPSPASDVYALAATLFRVLEGRPPDGAQPTRGPVAVIVKGLAHHPADRHADAGEFARELRAWLAERRAARHASDRAGAAEALWKRLGSEDRLRLQELLLRGLDRRGAPRRLSAATVRGQVDLVEDLHEAGALRRDGSSWILEPLVPEAWSRLAGWATPTELQRRAELEAGVRRWMDTGQGTDGLPGGEALAELRAWQRTSHPRLTPEEDAFLTRAVQTRARRERLRRTLVTGVAVAALVIAFLVLGLWQRAEDARGDATAALEEAHTRELLAAAGGAGDPMAALALYRAAEARGSDEAAVHVRRLAAGGTGALVLPGAPSRIWSVAWGPDGLLAESSADGTFRIWQLPGLGFQEHQADAPTWVTGFTPAGELVRSGPRQATVVGSHELVGDGAWWAALSTDRRLLVVPDGHLNVYDLSSGEPRQVARIDAGASYAAFSPEGDLLVGTTWAGGYSVYRTSDWSALPIPEGRSLNIEPVLSAAGGRVAYLDTDLGTRVFDVTGRVLPTEPLLVEDIGDDPTGMRLNRRAHEGATFIRMWPGGALAVAGSTGGLLRVHALDAGTHRDFATALGDRLDLAFARDGGLISLFSVDEGAVELWSSSGRVQSLQGHTAGVMAAAWSDDGRVATASYDRTVRVWTPAARWLVDPGLCEGEPLLRVEGRLDGAWVGSTERGLCLGEHFLGEADRVAVGADRIAAWTFEDRTLTVWDAKGEIGSWSASPLDFGRVTGFHIGPDQVVAVSDAGTWLSARLDEEGARLTWLRARDDRWGRSVVHGFVDDAVVLAGGVDEISLVALEGGAILSELGSGHHGRWQEESVAVGGGHVLTGSSSGTLKRWTASGDATILVQGATEILATAIAPDGDASAASFRDGRVWSGADGEGWWDSFDHPVVSLAHDGERLAACTATGEVRVWSADGGLLLVLDATVPTSSVSWLPGGELRLRTSRADQLWRVPEAPPDPGTLTNLRACAGTTRVVPVLPMPAPDTVWAPPGACSQD